MYVGDQGRLRGAGSGVELALRNGDVSEQRDQLGLLVDGDDVRLSLRRRAIWMGADFRLSLCVGEGVRNDRTIVPSCESEAFDPFCQSKR